MQLKNEASSLQSSIWLGSIAFKILVPHENKSIFHMEETTCTVIVLARFTHCHAQCHASIAHASPHATDAIQRWRASEIRAVNGSGWEASYVRHGSASKTSISLWRTKAISIYSEYWWRIRLPACPVGGRSQGCGHWVLLVGLSRRGLNRGGKRRNDKRKTDGTAGGNRSGISCSASSPLSNRP